MADEACDAVYHVSHHDRVKVCIPDPELRASVLWDLISNPELFIDVSSYSDDE